MSVTCSTRQTRPCANPRKNFYKKAESDRRGPVIFFLYYIYDCREKAGINRLFLLLLKLVFL